AAPSRPSGEARACPRYAANVTVRFASDRDFVVRYANDISAGGIFVRTDKPLPPGATVRLRVELPDGGPPVEAEAVVRRSVSPAEAARSGARAGVGLQFVGANDEFRARVDAFIEKLAAADDPPQAAAASTRP